MTANNPPVQTRPETGAESSIVEAERLLHQGEPLLAYNAAQNGLEQFPGHVRLAQLQALALARSGDTERANVLLGELEKRGLDDAETLGMLARTHSYFRLDRPNLVIEAVKRAEDGDGIIVRLYEAYRRRGTARLIVNGLCSRASRTDLLERDVEDLPVHGGSITLDYRPFEIITLRLR
jgi:hypothetical protein